MSGTVKIRVYERCSTMKDGFIKVAAATPELAVADCTFNTEQIISLMKKAQEAYP